MNKLLKFILYSLLAITCISFPTNIKADGIGDGFYLYTGVPGSDPSNQNVGDPRTDTDESNFTTSFSADVDQTKFCIFVNINQGARTIVNNYQNFSNYTANVFDGLDFEGSQSPDQIVITPRVAGTYSFCYDGGTVQLTVNQGQGGPGGGDCFAHFVDEDTKEYAMGLYFFENEVDGLNLIDYFGFKKLNKELSFDMYLIAVENSARQKAAPNDVYGLIENVQASFVDGDNNFETNRNKFSLNVGQQKVNVFDRNMYPVTMTIAPNAYGRFKIKTEFDLIFDGLRDPEHKETYIEFDILDPISFNITLDENEMEVNTFNSIFESYSALRNYCQVPDEVQFNDIIINLPNGTFEGDYKINLDGFDSYINVYGDKANNIGTTTIKGSIEVVGGSLGIRYVDFEADNSVKLSDSDLEIANKTIGVITRKANNNIHVAETLLERCNFKNYDYAAVSTYSGYIQTILNCTFTDCGYGYYMDCNGYVPQGGANAPTGNIFVDCKDAAIALVSNIKQYGELNTEMYRFCNNFFYNDVGGFDYYIGEGRSEADPATYYFFLSYYGKTKHLLNDTNVRKAKVKYKSNNLKKTTDVVTNPCLKYPSVLAVSTAQASAAGSEIFEKAMANSEGAFGIFNTNDEGENVNTAIFKGNKIVINKKDKDAIQKIDVVNDEGKHLGGLKHGKQN